MTERKKIFGTDGVRGVANVEPVTAETALKLGRAAAYVFAQMNPRGTPDGTQSRWVVGVKLDVSASQNKKPPRGKRDG